MSCNFNCMKKNVINFSEIPSISSFIFAELVEIYKENPNEFINYGILRVIDEAVKRGTENYNFSLNHKIKRSKQLGNDKLLQSHLDQKINDPKYSKGYYTDVDGTKHNLISHKRAQRLLWTAHDIDNRGKAKGVIDKDATIRRTIGVVTTPRTKQRIEVKYNSNIAGKSGANEYLDNNERYITQNSGNASTYLHELSHQLKDLDIIRRFKDDNGNYESVVNRRMIDALQKYKSPHDRNNKEGQLLEAERDIYGLTNLRRLGDWKNKRNSPLIKDAKEYIEKLKNVKNLKPMHESEPYREEKLNEAIENQNKYNAEHQKETNWMYRNIPNSQSTALG